MQKVAVILLSDSVMDVFVAFLNVLKYIFDVFDVYFCSTFVVYVVIISSVTPLQVETISESYMV